MPNTAIPIGSITKGDPTGTFLREILAMEQLQIDDGAQNCWPLSEFALQPVAKDWVGGADGRFVRAGQGRPYSDYRGVNFSNDASHVVIPYDNYDVTNQTYEVALLECSVAGTVISRRNFFEVDVIDNTTVRLIMYGETDIDASVNVMDGNVHTIAVIITATTYDLYVDGVSTGALAFVGAVPTAGYGIYLGREEVDGTTAFRGTLSQLAFYDSAVAAADLLLHFTYANCTIVVNGEMTVLDAGYESGAFGNGWEEVTAGETKFYTSYGGGSILPRTGTYMMAGTNQGDNYGQTRSDHFIDLSDYGITDSEIDEGLISLTCTLYTQGDGGDYVRFRFKWYDESEVFVSDGAWSSNWNNQGSWVKRTYTKTVPVGVRKVKLNTQHVNVIGSYKAACADDLSLTFTRTCTPP